METVILGRTGLEVTKLALGGLFLSELGGAFEDSKHATLKALELGINYIDTAPAYYDSEKVLGKILQEWEGPLVISTKLGGRPQPFDPQSKKALIQSVEMSLEYLHRDSIDILMIHEPDRVREYNWWTDELNYEGPVLEAIDEMKKAGMIKFSGLGGTTAHELARVCDSGKFDVVLTAYNYSLLWREAQYEIFQAAKRHHMGVVCGSPLQQGALAVRYDDAINHGAPWISEPRREQFRALYRLLDETGMGIVEMAIRFVISNPSVDCVLTGSSNEAQFMENYLAVEKGPLPADILQELDKIYAMVPFRPSLEYFTLPFDNNCKGQQKFY